MTGPGAARRWVALLRAVNAGGASTIRMSELRAIFTSAGFANVATYLQSGNVIFTATEPDQQQLTRRAERALQAALGRWVAAFVLSPAQLSQAAARNPFKPGCPGHACHLMFLSHEPGDAQREALMAVQGDDYRFAVRGKILYYTYPHSLQGRRRTVNFEKILGVTGTSRTCKVVARLTELAG
jgi:uncharacterized protein (DUF1697 family)